MEDVDFEMNIVNRKAKFLTYTLQLNDPLNDDHVKFISDGENIYLFKRNNGESKFYIKSKQMGRYIYFETKLSNQDAMYFFGLVGTIASHKGTPVILDTKTGLVSQLDNYSLFLLSREYPEIVREYKKTKRKLVDVENAVIHLNSKFE